MCVYIFCVFYIFYFVCACVLDVLNNSTFLTVSYSHIVATTSCDLFPAQKSDIFRANFLILRL